ncbi:hypothetical protein [Ezakiella peruensis]|uniref:hypothetical protein n=1 Tax=Ezakiella peruensis TaxID=1464038 RepID=UPI000C1B378F|nr:hypothetical protein [Ezakiella peruensis]
MKLLNRLSNLYLNLTTGLLAGLLLSAIGSLSTWLDMRIHANLTVIITMLVVMAALYIFKLKPTRIFFISELLALMFALIAGKFVRYIYDMREVLGRDVSIKTTGIVLAILLIAANIIGIVRWRKGVE